jgi:hypothetical protein
MRLLRTSISWQPHHSPGKKPCGYAWQRCGCSQYHPTNDTVEGLTKSSCYIKLAGQPYRQKHGSGRPVTEVDLVHDGRQAVHGRRRRQIQPEGNTPRSREVVIAVVWSVVLLAFSPPRTVLAPHQTVSSWARDECGNNSSIIASKWSGCKVPRKVFNFLSFLNAFLDIVTLFGCE